MNANHAQKEGIALFSGGYDSLWATFKTMELDGNADTVIHMDTSTGIPLNERFVEAVCNEYGWYLQKLRPKHDFWYYAKKYGFPGPSAHNWYYQYLKQHPLRRACKPYPDKPYLYTGVRKHESEARMGRVVDMDEREFAHWKAPIADDTDEDVEAALVEHDLPRSPVVESISRSGECYCMAYGIREFEIDLGHYDEDEDPPQWLTSHVRRLKRGEWRVQTYRGRVYQILPEEFPDAWELTNQKKDEGDHRLRLDVLRDYRPDVAEWLEGIPELKALRRGREEPQAWLGHGKMSSEELQRKTMPDNQEFLCENCKDSTSTAITHPNEDARLLVEPETPDSGEQVGFDDL
jgi:3'-phosphoadenosine 5'-phosphosulfate sulfotransferase (PAPS reductase)/FAD synthetase